MPSGSPQTAQCHGPYVFGFFMGVSAFVDPIGDAEFIGHGAAFLWGEGGADAGGDFAEGGFDGGPLVEALGVVLEGSGGVVEAGEGLAEGSEAFHGAVGVWGWMWFSASLFLRFPHNKRFRVVLIIC